MKNNIIKQLSIKFSIEEKEVLEKLELNENSSLAELAKALGGYSIFETKEKQTEFIKEKVSNKLKEVSTLENELADVKKEYEDFKNTNQINLETYDKTKEHINSYVKSEWKKIGIKRDFNLANVDLDKLDFNDLRKSLLQFAEHEGYAVEYKNTLEPNKETQEKDFKSNVTTLENGVVI